VRRHPVIILTIGGVLLGAALGRFFKVLILIPACLVILAAVIARLAFFGGDLLHLCVDYVVLIASLEIGYASAFLSTSILHKSQQSAPTPSASLSK
jgi:purine-cytosine permease-like protein